MTDNTDIAKLREQLLESIGYCFDWAEGETIGWAYGGFLEHFVQIGKTAEAILKKYRETHGEDE